MKRKAISVIFTVLLLSSVFIQSTHANSAQRHWSGTDSTGALVKDKNCPLVVDKELLTFDVQEFPNNSSPIQVRSRPSTLSATPPTIR